ncbi:hypothetical protein HDU76_003760 [Blyttiomyces sp. JEL0837]|nr:hypothetical protein HDU76_003760 [Blyttiomyces sp. JEL0837]
MAFQLASKLPEFREFLIQEMEKDNAKVPRGVSSILNMPSKAFKELIARADFLNVIRNQVEKLPRWARVFTTSRPEIDIYTILKGANSSILSPQDSNNIDHIQMFVQHQLSTQLSVDEVMEASKMTELVGHITEKSKGLFHYARLACKFLTDTSHSSWDALMEVANKFDGGLDQIYTQVLETIFADANRETTERFQKVLGVIVTARLPLSQASIAKLVGLSVAEVGGIIFRVQSILSISNGELKVLHTSFKDFLLSNERCKNPLYSIDAVLFESIMASSCLQVMTTELTGNMAQLKDDTASVTALNVDVLDSCLAYACQFWIPHFLACQDTRVLLHLSSFTSKALLFWMEAMILLGCLPKEMGNEIGGAAQKIADFNTGETVWKYDSAQELLEDAARFLWRFEEVISHNPLQIYSVGVTFTPQATKLYQTYQSLGRFHSGSVKTLPPTLQWGSLYKHFIGHLKAANILSFSNDGLLLISSSWREKKVRLGFGHMSDDQQIMVTISADKKGILAWDVSNWKVKHTLDIDFATVGDVTFSSDSRLLAIALPPQSIIIIDAMNGSTLLLAWLRTLLGYPGSKELSPIAVSRDGQFIASGVDETVGVCVSCYDDDDNNISLWDLTGRYKADAPQHQTSLVVASVLISPDGKKIACLTGGKTIVLWDIQGEKILGKSNSAEHVEVLAWSYDGRKLISGGWSGVVRVWDVAGKFECAMNLQGHGKGEIQSVCFTKFGLHAASSEKHDSTIIWSLKNGMALTKIPAVGFVQSLSNGSWFLVAFDPFPGRKVTIWNLNASTITKTFERDTDSLCVDLVCFSSDGCLVAINDDRSTLTVWDVASGAKLRTFRIHSGGLEYAQFSSDNQRLLTAAKEPFDKKQWDVHEWNVNTGNKIRSIEGSIIDYLSRHDFVGANYVAGSDTIAACFNVSKSLAICFQ